jgi:hypothetical protein
MRSPLVEPAAPPATGVTAPTGTTAGGSISGPLSVVAVVGAGPRGVSIIERLVAASRTEDFHGRLTVHLIDPYVDRGGSVWRRDQSEVLLMNTATCQTTMYPDASCHARLPLLHARTLADHLATEGLGPADVASRAAHGRYLTAVLERALADADPARLRILTHAAEVVDIHGAPDGPQEVSLSDGTTFMADAVGLALGHLATAPGPRSQQFAHAAERHHLAHIAPANPLETHLEEVLGRERIAVQGMGLNFYDAVGLLTEAAGGRFVDRPSAPSGLRYLPGGGEPQLVVGSRSGMIYRPTPDLRPVLPEPYTPRILTAERVLDLSVRQAGVDHERDVMPLLLAELVRAFDEAGFDEMADESAVLSLLFPFGRRGGPMRNAHVRTRDELRRALDRATAPDPMWLLAFRVLTAGRIQVNRLVDLGAYTTESLSRDIDGHLRNAFASWASGPPAPRVRQLLALEEAGLVRFVGPGMRIDVDEQAGRFRATGAQDCLYLCDGVLEAHLPAVDLNSYTAPLLRAWRERGEVFADAWRSRGTGRRLPTGSIAVDGLYCPVAKDGRVFERRLMVGVPVSTAQPGSAITAEPGTGAPLLQHTEAVARRLAAHAGVLPTP